VKQTSSKVKEWFTCVVGRTTHHPEWRRSLGSEKIYDIESHQDTWPADFVRDRLYPEDRQAVLEIVGKAHLDNTDYDISYRIVLPDGSIKYVHSVGHPVVNESGELIEVVGTSMDVTEQWKARAELEKAFEEIKQRTEAARRSERDLRDVVNTVPAHVWEPVIYSRCLRRLPRCARQPERRPPHYAKLTRPVLHITDPELVR
jgi:hypothetical protein